LRTSRVARGTMENRAWEGQKASWALILLDAVDSLASSEVMAAGALAEGMCADCY
jgi:hypothetical protein